MARVALLLLFLCLAVGATTAVPQSIDRSDRAATTATPTRGIGSYAGLGRLFRELAGSTAQATPEQAAARLFDFEQVVRAVAGVGQASRPGSALEGHTLAEYAAAFNGLSTILIPTDRAARRRDDTAYRLHSLGYSAKEIADILAGRITRTALDNAQKMLMTGSRTSLVSDYLDREYGRLAALAQRRQDAIRKNSRPNSSPPPGAAQADAYVVRYAAVHGVDAALVRAVIDCESGWNPEARSKVGAIGLMQLMPGTARQLGVNPLDPEQNVEGGVRYLAGLLRIFRTNEHALIAYNAGPGFADRYVHGQAALYGETREFVKNVLERLVR
ncbi:MAG TPA: lytic transglycosylase domain-containing protein [Vicinamibacterales bacterium]|jgi:soluble lytic murein transglycosylase-like protein